MPFEMGSTITSQGKCNVLVMACVGTLFICTSLLGVTIWLQVVALQFEIRTLRGRVEYLERSHELHIELNAFSQVELRGIPNKHRSGNENVVDRLLDHENAVTRNEGNETKAAVQRNDYYSRKNSGVYNGRHKREAGSDIRNINLPAFQKRKNSPQNWTYGLQFSNTSPAPPANHQASVVMPIESASMPTLKKNEARKRKMHNHRKVTSFASTPKMYSTSTEATIISRPSHEMKTDTGFLGSMIMPTASRSQPIYEEARLSPVAAVRPFTTNRRRRPKHAVAKRSVETLDERAVRPTRARKIVAAHYDGDTSRYTSAHEHYEAWYRGEKRHMKFAVPRLWREPGDHVKDCYFCIVDPSNGRLRHPDGKFRDWTPGSWMQTLGMNSHFSLSEHGNVTVQNSGLYFVYVQIYYVDEHDTNGFRLYKNRNAILHCTAHSSNTDHGVQANTCFTASLAYLNVNDQIYVSDVEGLRYSLFEPAKSFFGLFKVSNDKQK